MRLLLLILLLLGGVLYSALEAQKIPEEIILFRNPSTESDFVNKDLEQLKKTLEEKKFQYKEIDVSQKGAPELVHYTPFILYQNYEKRINYKGRHSTHDRFLNFLRTARFLPKGDEAYTKKNTFVYKDGRFQLVLGIKITDLAGTVPEDFDKERFIERVYKGLAKGLRDYDLRTTQKVTTSDVVFHMDFYPYRSADDKLYVSYKLFSNYDCIQAIHIPAEAVWGSYKKLEKVFAQAASNMHEELKNQLAHSELGDAMQPVSELIKTRDWTSLGLDLPPAPVSGSITNSDLAIAESWVYEGGLGEDIPSLQFSFPAPLHQYSGELDEIRGELELNPQKELSQSKASFEVDIQSLTMGLDELDEAIHEKILKTANHPVTRFDFIEVSGENTKLAWGKMNRVVVRGQLQLLSQKIEVEAPTQIELYLNDAGEPRLHLQSSFEIDQLKERFQIETPKGPREANNRILVNINLSMQPQSD